MIKTLQKKFILTAMIAITVLLTVLLGAINVVNVWTSSRETDNMLTFLSNRITRQSPTRFPERRPFLGRTFTEDDAISAVYFMAHFDDSGELDRVDVSRIASVTEEQAKDLAAQAHSKEDSGKIGKFKYISTTSTYIGGTIYIFLDTTLNYVSIVRIIGLSLVTGIICWLLMFLLVAYLSQKAIRPIAENIQRQRQFVTDAGHEIKTPLAIILANTDAMELHNGENKWSKNIRNQVIRLNGLMQNLLILARADEEKRVEHPEHFNLADFYGTVTAYPDVKPSHWAAAYINMAAKGKNIITGFSDGQFYPDRTVTMGQAVTILLRVLGYQDGDIGGVWPDSYFSVGTRVGLLDGVSQKDGNAPLTRASAARLFLNLLQADCAGDGGSFLVKMGLQTKEDAVLVSSTAAGPDGRKNALQLASGEVYQLAGEKESNGALNGSRGTLVLKNGKALTFLPSSESTARTITLSGASALQFTDTAGEIYAVENGTGVYQNGKQQTWSEVYAWLNPGTSLTVYLNDAGNPVYIVVGGGTVAEAAVVVYQKGSIVGFDSLTGGAGSYTIYKNGCSATSRDLLPYDVATYSAATNSVRVCDTRITGYYESCRPNPAEAAYVTVMGCEIPVLTTAQASLAAFKPGDQITLLLTEDNQVAGAVKAGAVSETALGVVKSNSGGNAEVELFCGLTIRGSADEIMAEAGDLVRVVSEDKGVLRLYRQGSEAGGELNLTKRTLGNTALAESVTVLEQGTEGLGAADINQLPALIPASQVRYARKNWAGKVDLILLGSNTRSTTLYGRAVITSKYVERAGSNEETGNNERTGDWIYYLEVENGQGSKGPFELGGLDIITGDFVSITTNQTGSTLINARKLTRLANVPNTAWSGRTSVIVDGQSREVPVDVVCWNQDSQSWTTLDAARAYADKADLYADMSGVIRVISVGG